MSVCAVDKSSSLIARQRQGCRRTTMLIKSRNKKIPCFTLTIDRSIDLHSLPHLHWLVLHARHTQQNKLLVQIRN